MKNIFWIAVLGLGFGISANAQTETTTTKTTTTKTTSAVKNFSVIDRKTIDNATLERIGTRFGGYSITEAQRSPDGEIKLKLSKQGKNTTAYFSPKGEFIREE